MTTPDPSNLAHIPGIADQAAQQYAAQAADWNANASGPPQPPQAVSANGNGPAPIVMKGWDQYVKEALKPDLLLPLPDGTQLRISQPKGRVLKRIGPALERMDLDAVLFLLLGDEPGRKVLELMDDAPLETLNAFVTDVMQAFGIDPEALGVFGTQTGSVGNVPGESPASSN